MSPRNSNLLDSLNFQKMEPPYDGRSDDRGGAAAQVIDARFHAHAAVGRPRYSRCIELVKLACRYIHCFRGCYPEPPCRQSPENRLC